MNSSSYVEKSSVAKQKLRQPCDYSDGIAKSNTCISGGVNSSGLISCLSPFVLNPTRSNILISTLNKMALPVVLDGHALLRRGLSMQLCYPPIRQRHPMCLGLEFLDDRTLH